MSDNDRFYTTAEEITDYHYSLGRFVTRFADIEALLRLQCAVLSEVPVDLAGLIFGELNAGSGGDMLNRLRAAKGLGEDAELMRALKQFGNIAQMRNAILHRGVDFDEAAFATKSGLPNSRRQR